MARWLSRLALYLVPRRWREPVLSDLSDEALGARHGVSVDLWCAWHLARVGVRLRWKDVTGALVNASLAGGRGLVVDIRLAFRMIARQPASTAAIVTTLALGIGATAAAYAVFNTILFRPVPGVHDPDRIVTVDVEAPSAPGVWVNYSASRLLAALRGTAALEGPAAGYQMTVPVVAGDHGDPERLDVMAVRDSTCPCSASGRVSAG